MFHSEKNAATNLLKRFPLHLGGALCKGVSRISSTGFSHVIMTIHKELGPWRFFSWGHGDFSCCPPEESYPSSFLQKIKPSHSKYSRAAHVHCFPGASFQILVHVWVALPSSGALKLGRPANLCNSAYDYVLGTLGPLTIITNVSFPTSGDRKGGRGGGVPLFGLKFRKAWISAPSPWSAGGERESNINVLGTKRPEVIAWFEPFSLLKPSFHP